MKHGLNIQSVNALLLDDQHPLFNDLSKARSIHNSTRSRFMSTIAAVVDRNANLDHNLQEVSKSLKFVKEAEYLAFQVK